MAGKPRNIDWDGAERLDKLLRDKGWGPRDVARASERTGNPLRVVRYRTVYRVLSEGHLPRSSTCFEIAATLGYKPSKIWKKPLRERMDQVAA